MNEVGPFEAFLIIWGTLLLATLAAEAAWRFL